MCFGPSVNPAAGAAYGGTAGMLGPSGGAGGGGNMSRGGGANLQPWFGGPFGFGGGFDSSPWLPFLINYFSSFGRQPMGVPQAGGVAAPSAAAPPAQPSLPAQASVSSQPDAALPPTQGNAVATPPAAPPSGSALVKLGDPIQPLQADPTQPGNSLPGPFGGFYGPMATPASPTTPVAGLGAATFALPRTGLGGLANLFGT